MDASTITIPFPTTSPWLQQIAATYIQAVQGNPAAAKEIKDVALQTDAQWAAGHPSADPHTFDYARNAYKAAYAALQALGLFSTGGSSDVQGGPTTSTGAPAAPGTTNGGKRGLVLAVVVLLAVYLVARWL